MEAYTPIGPVNNQTILSPKGPASSSKPNVKHTYTPSKRKPSNGKHIPVVKIAPTPTKERNMLKERPIESPRKAKIKISSMIQGQIRWLRDGDYLKQTHNQNNT
jgi:hypothetical protein